MSSSTLKRPATGWATSGARGPRGPKPVAALFAGVTVSGVPQKTHTFAVPGGRARAQRGQVCADGSFAGMASPRQDLIDAGRGPMDSLTLLRTAAYNR